VLLTCILEQGSDPNRRPIRIFISNWLNFNFMCSVALVVAYVACYLIHRGLKICSNLATYLIYVAMLSVPLFVRMYVDDMSIHDLNAFLLGAYITSVFGVLVAFWYAHPDIIHNQTTQNTIPTFSAVDDFVAACLIVYCTIYYFLWLLAFFTLFWLCCRRNKCCV
jgi:predicted outer membrane lipoprotein